MGRQIEFIKDYSPNPAVYVHKGARGVADEWEEEGLTTVTLESAISKNGSKELDINSVSMAEHTKDI